MSVIQPIGTLKTFPKEKKEEFLIISIINYTNLLWEYQ